MAERVVVSRGRGAGAPPKEFIFTSEQVRGFSEAGPLGDYRRQAWQLFESLPIPTTNDEPWRRTDIRGLHPAGVHLPGNHNPLAQRLDGPPAELLQPLAGEAHGGQLVLTAGGVQCDLAPELVRQGVIFTDLQTAERQHPELLSKLMGRAVPASDGKFAAMAAALAQTGVLVYVPRGVHVEKPLHSIAWGAGTGLAFIDHVLVWVDDGASLTYVHESASITEPTGQSLHSGLVEIVVGDEAKLHFVELQSWGDHVWNISHERALVGRDATLDWIFGAIGSHVTKNFSQIDLAGRGATGRMSGFYFTDGDQHLDHDTQQNHLAPNTTSDLLFKGALRDHSRSVWQGMIYVAPGAQKTDGYQANRNLVLSPNARADSIPGLEILADDVRCTHGATVGKIDAEQVFYLRSRGIPYREAERLIVEGFFDPIMQRIPFEGVRTRFQDAIMEKMA